eukprot:TRINITY_DN12121_c0_g1_i1.p1 TRINITY_DN12121_c0_g1~~TRINITY_DN12121_c0_g1_i1.p1  ORF type:complete len:1085 (-),score=319.40 TRINITY_DN12121_c0_g1_i1:19-3273(-)
MGQNCSSPRHATQASGGIIEDDTVISMKVDDKSIVDQVATLKLVDEDVDEETRHQREMEAKKKAAWEAKKQASLVAKQRKMLLQKEEETREKAEELARAAEEEVKRRIEQLERAKAEAERIEKAAAEKKALFEQKMSLQAAQASAGAPNGTAVNGKPPEAAAPDHLKAIDDAQRRAQEMAALAEQRTVPPGPSQAEQEEEERRQAEAADRKRREIEDMKKMLQSSRPQSEPKAQPRPAPPTSSRVVAAPKSQPVPGPGRVAPPPPTQTMPAPPPPQQQQEQRLSRNTNASSRPNLQGTPNAANRQNSRPPPGAAEEEEEVFQVRPGEHPMETHRRRMMWDNEQWAKKAAKEAAMKGKAPPAAPPPAAAAVAPAPAPVYQEEEFRIIPGEHPMATQRRRILWDEQKWARRAAAEEAAKQGKAPPAAPPTSSMPAPAPAPAPVQAAPAPQVEEEFRIIPGEHPFETQRRRILWDNEKWERKARQEEANKAAQKRASLTQPQTQQPPPQRPSQHAAPPKAAAPVPAADEEEVFPTILGEHPFETQRRRILWENDKWARRAAREEAAKAAGRPPPTQSAPAPAAAASVPAPAAAAAPASGEESDEEFRIIPGENPMATQRRRIMFDNEKWTRKAKKEEERKAAAAAAAAAQKKSAARQSVTQQGAVPNGMPAAAAPDPYGEEQLQLQPEVALSVTQHGGDKMFDFLDRISETTGSQLDCLNVAWDNDSPLYTLTLKGTMSSRYQAKQLIDAMALNLGSQKTQTYSGPTPEAAQGGFLGKKKDAGQARGAQAANRAVLSGLFSAGAKAKVGGETCLVMMRHSERLDHVDPSWRQTPEGSTFPFDSPITEKGGKITRKVSRGLANTKASAPFVAVATSPYRRCVETAADLCKIMNLPLIIDQELGEVWEACMPPVPNPWRRPLELEKLVSELGVRCLNPVDEHGGLLVYGRAPTWPEELEVAHGRYAVRIQRYLLMSANLGKNIIVVTHADCLAAALMKFERHTVNVTGMDYCATVVARCPRAPKEGNAFASQWKVDVSNVKVEKIKSDENKHIDRCKAMDPLLRARASSPLSLEDHEIDDMEAVLQSLT